MNNQLFRVLVLYFLAITTEATKYWLTRKTSGNDNHAFNHPRTQNMNRTASVVWEGNLREGFGTMCTESGVLFHTQYSFRTRFDEGIGTNPDELIAASLGGCFSMSLSNELELCGLHPERIDTTATATLEQLVAGWTLTRIQLDVRAKVPHATQSRFIDAALAAKTKCPMARLLNTNISMTARLDI
jgi:lipoyl-dependent peroxiredoxin